MVTTRKNKNTKYNAQGVWYDLVRRRVVPLPPDLSYLRQNFVYFHSYFEYQVYEKLSACFSPSMIQIHPKVIIKPPKDTPAITWIPDFFLGDLIVEAKGFFTPSFRQKMALLADHKPAIYSHTWIIAPNARMTSLLKKRFAKYDVSERIVDFTARNPFACLSARRFD